MNDCEDTDPFIRACSVVIRTAADMIDRELDADRHRADRQLTMLDHFLYGLTAAGGRALVQARGAQCAKGNAAPV